VSAVLHGVRVLDFGRYIAGPYCAALLAEYGAEVIRVERRGGGEDRFVAPVAPGGDGALFLQMNRNKLSLTLDPMAEEGREIVRKLVATADVVVANLPPAALAALRLDYASLRAVKPDVILTTVSAYGRGGPLSERLGFDGIGQAMSGAVYMGGEPGRPSRAAVSWVDFATALHAAFGTLVALMSRARTGTGQVVEAALLPTAVALNGVTLIEQAILQPHAGPPTDRCREGAGVRYIPGLIAGPPRAEPHLWTTATHSADEIDEFQQAHRILRPAAQVECAAADRVDVGECSEPGRDCVIDVQGVADLQAVAKNRDRAAPDGLQHEVGNPTLIFRSELAGSVDAAHPQRGGAQAIDACIVADIVVGGSLGAAVRTIEVEGGGFGDAATNSSVSDDVALAVPNKGAGRKQPAVDLVGGGKHYGRPRIVVSQGLQHVQSAARVDLEIVNRPVEACRHRDLSRKMQNRGGTRHRPLDLIDVANVGRLDRDPIAVPLLQPSYIFLRAVSRHVVEHQDGHAPGRKRIGYITSDKSAAAGDQNRRHRIASRRM